jgi:hypothetical protein
VSVFARGIAARLKILTVRIRSPPPLRSISHLPLGGRITDNWRLEGNRTFLQQIGFVPR